MMVLSALEVQKGNQTLGDFVFINAMLMQLSIPLNFIGFVYREIRQGLTDIEQMFDLLAIEPGNYRQARGKAAGRWRGRHPFRQGRFQPMTSAQDPQGRLVRGAAGKTIAIVGPSGAGKSTISRLLFRFYDVTVGQHHHRRPGHARRDASLLRAAIGMVPQDTVLFNDTIPTTSAMAGSTQATTRWRKRPSWPRSTTSS
jgi:ABC-type transport system involved in Fe-S cluster assembly fused permease/ATPase subunit